MWLIRSEFRNRCIAGGAVFPLVDILVIVWLIHQCQELLVERSNGVTYFLTVAKVILVEPVQRDNRGLDDVVIIAATVASAKGNVVREFVYQSDLMVCRKAVWRLWVIRVEHV